MERAGRHGALGPAGAGTRSSDARACRSGWMLAGLGGDAFERHRREEFAGERAQIEFYPHLK